VDKKERRDKGSERKGNLRVLALRRR